MSKPDSSPTDPLSSYPLPPNRIGIDLGGTKTEIIVLDDAGLEIYRKRVPTPRDYDGTLRGIRDLVSGAEAATGQEASVGLGIPGSVSPTRGTIRNANSTWLNGSPFHLDLEGVLDRPVRLANDANCFTLSEATDGAGAGESIVFGVIIGTGVGGGITHRGRLLEGHQHIAGEWGHNPLPWPADDERPGRTCYCGLRGCIETFLSGPGMAADHEERTGTALTTREIVDLASGGDPGATFTVDRYAGRLARALATVVNVLDPDVIVLGGGMSNLPELARRTREALPPWVFSDDVLTRIVRNVHGDSSGVRGAAWLWPPSP